MSEKRLTDHAREFIAHHIRRGYTVIDATAGNGHDTLFLAEQVGKTGRVYAFDIQTKAIDQVRSRLQQAGHSDQLILLKQGHQYMRASIPVQYHGGVSAIMFNLGYLPGGCHGLTTQFETTLKALDQACTLLAPGGVISIVAYPGHEHGKLETGQVLRWSKGLSATNYRVEQLITETGNRPAPVWIGITKSKQ